MKVVIIGIDGMDRDLIKKYINDLPVFQKIAARSPEILSTSVFPPDSDTAWATIYTGLNPAKHGIVDFVDPLERKKITDEKLASKDLESIKGKTFWDLAGNHDIKSCLLYPHLIFPIWQVNGLVINRDPHSQSVHIFPKEFDIDYELNKSQLVLRIPRSRSEFEKYLKYKRKTVNEEFDLAVHLMKKYEWDLFFLYSSSLDSIKHIFWNYCDEDDPTYPGDTKFKNVVKDFYILLDSLIGNLLNKMSEDVPVLLFSDHGHSMRPVSLFNVNEILRKEGLLKSHEKGRSVNNLKQNIKRTAVNIAQKSGLRPAAQTVLRIFPSIKDSFVRPSNIDFNDTVAHCTDLSGLKSYSYGGIKINKKIVNDREELSEIKKKILTLLQNYKHPESGEIVVDWIKGREELYEGEYLDKYPEILFNLKENYGAGWEINVPEFTESHAHKFFPGSHRGSTPIFYLLNSTQFELRKKEIELVDIAPTILKLLNIDYEDSHFDGESII